MGKVIFQIKSDSRDYNRFVLLEKNKNGEYKAKDLMANKDVHIQYYNKIFVDGDFEGILEKTDLQKVLDYMKDKEILRYINTNFKEIEKFL